MEITNPDSRQAIREAFIARNVPEEAVEFILASLSENTLKQYHKPIQAWVTFCSERNTSPVNADVKSVLDFLTPIAKKLHNYATLNSYRSAVSLISSWDVGNNPIIKRFCKGVSVLKPQRPKYNETWDPSTVLDFISNLPPNDDLSLKSITLKLATLLALTTAQRVQTLSKINVKNIILNDVGASIKIPDRLKTSGGGRYQPNLAIPAFSQNQKICPVHTLKSYLQKTEEIRGPNEETLFITFKKPHHKASPQTISRWIKQTLMESGINTNIFTAHSTRHAATSAAASRGVDVETIRRTAGWSSKSEVFARCYNRPLAVKTFEFANSIYSSHTS